MEALNIREFIGQWDRDFRDVLLRPSEFFERAGEKEYSESAAFTAVVGLLTGSLIAFPIALISIFAGDASLSAISYSIGFLVAFPAMLLAFTLILSSFTQLFLYFNGIKGYQKTFAAYAHAMALAPFSLIPIINLVASFYQIYIQYLGVKKLHDMRSLDAFIVVLVPAIVVSAAVFLLQSVV